MIEKEERTTHMGMVSWNPYGCLAMFWDMITINESQLGFMAGFVVLFEKTYMYILIHCLISSHKFPIIYMTRRLSGQTQSGWFLNGLMFSL